MFIFADPIYAVFIWPVVTIPALILAWFVYEVVTFALVIVAAVITPTLILARFV